MIEPAGLGIPVCFGPNTTNFSDTVDQLIENEAAEVVHDGKQLLAFMQWSFRTPHLASAMGQRAQQVVGLNQGAAARTVDGVFNAISPLGIPAHSSEAGINAKAA